MSGSRCLRPLLVLCRPLPRLFVAAEATACVPNCLRNHQRHQHVSNGSAMRSLIYEKKVDEALESLCDQAEEILSRSQRVRDYDVSLSSGVLTVDLGESGTYVINKQSANQQIWLSSPVSGPQRYDLIKDSWVYQKDGRTLEQLLSQELTQILREEVTVKLN